MPYNLTNKGNLQKTGLIDTEKRLVIARSGGREVGEMGKGGQKTQTFSYKTSKSWGYNAKHGGDS